MFPNKLLQGWGASTHKLIHLLATLKNHESWQGPDSNLSRNVVLFIRIDFDKLDRTERLVGGQFFKHRAYEPARTTPWSPKVDYNNLARVDKSLELGVAKHRERSVIFQGRLGTILLYVIPLE